jgi:hypothetical protein
MSSYLISGPTLERHNQAADLILGKPPRLAGEHESVRRAPPTTHRAVFITGAPVSGRWPMKLQYRDEEASPPAWKDYVPAVTGWAIPLNDGETLEQGQRYKGMLVDTHPTDHKAVFACVVGGGGENTCVARITADLTGGRYDAVRGDGTFNPQTLQYERGVRIRFIDAAVIGIPNPPP